MLVRRIAFVFGACLFVALIPSRPYALSTVLKVLPLVFLVPFGRREPWMIGIPFSLAGDVLLDIDRARLFIPALVSFLVGYGFYSQGFWRDRRLRGARAGAALAMVAYAAGFAILLLPHLGALKLPVVAYAIGLANLGASAAARGTPGAHGARTYACGALGALSLMISDSLVGIDRFWPGATVPFAWVMATYYLGQWGVLEALTSRSLRRA